ncbi:MAG: RDD family protein [Chloroflexota bacterium]|nr:RDD family protein [Chloroflexota bacterium]
MPDANPFRRLVAYWIDITLLYAALVSLQLGFASLTDGVVADWLGDRLFLLWVWIFLTISLPMWLYFMLLESGPRQATVGKSLLGLQVTDMAGNRLKRPRATLRTASKLAFFEIGHLTLLFPTPLFDDPEPSFRAGIMVVMALMVVYFAVALVAPRHQSVHDLLAKTLVVSRPKVPTDAHRSPSV